MTKFKIPGRDCVGCSQSGEDIDFQDEGVSLGAASIVDFVGDGVTATKAGSKLTVTVTGGGSSGGSGLTNWPIASGPPTGAALGARYYLTGASGVILGEGVAEGTTMEALIANPVNRADWYFNFGGS